MGFLRDQFSKKGKDGKKEKKRHVEEKVKILRIDSAHSGIFLMGDKHKEKIKIANGETYSINPKTESFFWIKENKGLKENIYRCYVAIKGVTTIANWKNVFEGNYKTSKVSSDEMTQLLDMELLRDLLNVQVGVNKKDVIIYIIIGAVLGWIMKDFVVGLI